MKTHEGQKKGGLKGCQHPNCIKNRFTSRNNPMKKGHVPWNKGLTKEKDRRVKQSAQNRTGRKITEKTRQLLREKAAKKKPRTGVKQSQITIRKRIETTKERHPNHFATMGSMAHLYEDEIAKTINADAIFKPQQVCDRIIIRNGQIYFVEIKLEGQKLRPKQKQFQAIAGEKYEVLYGKRDCAKVTQSHIPIIFRS